MRSSLPLFSILALLALGTACGSGERSDTGGYGNYGSYDTGYGGGDADDTQSTDDELATDDEDTEVPECDPTTKLAVWISPDDSNSMSSPAVLRALGTSMSHLRPRPYEFFNYFQWGYPAAETGDVHITADLAQDPDGPDGQFRLQFGLASEARTERAPMNLTFSVDTSGSMSGEAMANLKHSLRAISHQLKAGDKVSMVEWSSTAGVSLDGHAVTGPDDPTLANRINALTTSGGTDLDGGLVRAYQLAEKHKTATTMDRVVLISDGGANLGVTSADLIAAKAGSKDERGIYLTGIGVGTGRTYDDDLMDAVTDKGKGASVFIGSEQQATAVLGERFLEVFDVAARNVEIQLTLPDGFEIVKTSAEAVSAVREEIPPQHLAPNDAMVVHNVIKGCGPVDPATAELSILAQWQHPITFETRQTTFTGTFADVMAASNEARWLKGRAVLAIAEPRIDGAITASTKAAVSDALAKQPDDTDTKDLAAYVGVAP